MTQKDILDKIKCLAGKIGNIENDTNALLKQPIIENSNIATRIFGGRMGTINNTTAKTYQISTTTAQHFDAIRVIFVNTAPNLGINNITAKVCVSGSSANISNNGGSTWTNVLKNGQSNFCVPNSPGVARIQYTLSDWIPLSSINRSDGGKFPIVIIRAYIQGPSNLPAYGQGSSPDLYTNWESIPNGRFWIARQQDGDHVTTLTGFNTTTNMDQSPIVGFQYLSRGKVVSIMGVGDSITDGIGTYRGEGFGMLITNELSDMNKVALEWSNCGWASQTPTQYTNRAIDILNSKIKPDILLFPVGSPNGVVAPITDTQMRDFAGKAQSVVAKCNEKNVQCILWTWLPTNTAVKNYGESDSARVELNNNFISLNSKGFYVADTAKALSGEIIGGQVQMLNGSTIDGIHPNDSGNIIMKETILPFVKKLIGS